MIFSFELFEHQPLLAFMLCAILVISTLVSLNLANKRLGQHKLRAVFVGMANVALALTIMSFALNMQVKHLANKTVTLLTAGVQVEQLTDLDTDAPIFRLADADFTLNESVQPPSIPVVHSVQQLMRLEPHMTTLHLVGDGLSKQQWQDAKRSGKQELIGINIEFSPSVPRLGLINMHWQKQLVVGEFNHIKGQLQSSNTQGNTIYELNLYDPSGEVVDSTRLKPNEDFSFQFPTKSVGQWRYQLKLTQINDTSVLANEPVAFNVVKQPEVKILIKQAAPSFETRQFKNWASQFEAKITILTTISQNKDIRQDVNYSPQALTQLTYPFSEDALHLYDIVVIDGRSLLALSARKMQALEQAVKWGLGVYVITDQQLVDAWPLGSLSWLKGEALKPRVVESYFDIPIWPNSNVEESISLTKAEIVSPKSKALVTSQSGQVLVSNTQVGLGNVSLSLINTTHGWQTAGLTSQYSHYWQMILQHTARALRPPYWLPAEANDIQFSHNRYNQCLCGSLDGGGVEQSNLRQSVNIELVPDSMQDDKHCATIWHSESGWNNLTYKNDKQSLTSTAYVYEREDWQAWRQASNMLVTQEALERQTKLHTPKLVAMDISKWWFWWAFISLSTFLWLERKLYSS